MEDFKKTTVTSGYDRHRQLGQVPPVKKGWWIGLKDLWHDHKGGVVALIIIVFGIVYAFGQYQQFQKNEAKAATEGDIIVIPKAVFK